jgi:hypothetical protein
VATDPSLLNMLAERDITQFQLTYIGAVSETRVSPPATRLYISLVAEAGQSRGTHQSVLKATSNNAHRSARQKGQSSCRTAMRIKLY